MPPIRHNGEGNCLHNQNEGIPTKHPRSSTSSTLNYESETPSETKHIEWKVKNISRGMELAKITDPNNTVEIDAIRFTAGDSIDRSSDWEFSFKYSKTTERFVVVLCLLDYKGNSENVFAELTFFLKLPNGSIFRQTPCHMQDWKLKNNWVYFFVTTCEELKNSNVILDDAFTIYMDFTVCLKNRARTATIVENEKSMKVMREDIMRQFEMFLEDGTYSDFTIKIPKPVGESDGYEIFQVHKIMLAARSSVFKAMFEAQMRETKTGEVVITDVSPLAMKILLKFMYTGILDDEWILTPEEVIVAADKYQVETMKELCENNFAQVLTPSNALHMMKLSKILNLQKASKLVLDYVKSNLSDIYDET